VLEDALAQRLLGGMGAARPQPLGVDAHQLPGFDLAHEVGGHDVERAALARDHVAVPEPPEAQGPEPVGVAQREHRARHQHDQGIGAGHLAGGLDQRVLGVLGARDRHEVREHLGVERGLEDGARLLEPLPQLARVTRFPLWASASGPPR